MPISIHLVQYEQLKSLAAGSTQVDGFRVLPGSIPEKDRLQAHALSVKERGAPVWTSIFLVVDEPGRNIVGSANFHAEPAQGRVEIGYEIASGFRCRGYATEAVRLLIETAFGFPHVREVFAQTEVDNAASRRVLEKAGFRHCGKAVHPYYGPVDQWISRPAETNTC